MPQAAAVALYNFVTWVGTTAAAVSGGAISASSATAAAVSAVDAGIKLALLSGVNAVIANNNKPEYQGGMINLTINPNEPRRLQIGTRMNAGVLMDWQIKGSKNQNLFMVVYLGEGPMGQIKKVYGGGRVVYSTPISHGVRTVIPNYRSGGDRLWITYYDGRPGQTADAYMQSQFPGVWTANHVGEGCAYAIIEAQWDSDNLTSPPQIAFEMEGAKFYDRRLDSTAGGIGSHRLNNPATWALTTNPRVALDHYMLGRYLGAIRTFGIGLDPANVPYADFAAGANLCDEAVALKYGGTQKRYEANGFLFADRTFKDTIKDLCRAMNAMPADKGGQIGILDGQPKTPVMTITDDDVISGTVETYRPKQSWGELVSGAEGTYIDSRQNYNPVSYPRVTNPVWDAEDNGQPKMESLDFEMETSQERAERLATLYVLKKRRQARLTGIYRLKTIKLEQGDWFIRSGGKFGAGKTFEVLDRILDPRTMHVTLVAFEVDATDSAWVETDAADEAPAPTPDDSSLPGLGDPDVTVAAFSYTAGGLTFPALRFTNNLAADPVPYGVHIEYAFSDGAGTPGPTGEVFTQTMPPTMAQAAIYGLFPNQTYVVRLRHFSGETLGAWTAWGEISTSATYSAGEATSMDWANVYGTGRPFDFADVTGVNFAAGFAGQGALATRNALAYGDAELSGFGSFAALSSLSSAIADANNLLRYSAGGLFVGDLDADTTAANIAAGFSGQGALATQNSLAYGGSYLTNFGILAGRANVYFGSSYLLESNGGAQATTANFRTNLGTAAAIAGQGSFATLSSISNAVANANNLLRFSGGGLFSGDLAADVTGSNIAAGFSGQGALATLSTVNYAQISGGAVSDTQGASNDAAQNVNHTNAWVTVQSKAITCIAGDDVLILGQTTLGPGSLPWSDGFNAQFADLRLTRNGVAIRTFGEEMYSRILPVIEIDNPGAGTHTYAIQAKYRNSSGLTSSTSPVSNRTIALLRLRR